MGASLRAGLLAVLVALLDGGATSAAIAADPPADRTTEHDTASDDGPPGTLVDPRVEAARERITELPPPAPLVRIIQPLPASHRITTDPQRIAMSESSTQAAFEAMRKGVEFLIARQRPNGAWMEDSVAAPTGEPQRAAPVTIAVTALAIKALAQASPESASADRAPDTTTDSTPGATPGPTPGPRPGPIPPPLAAQVASGESIERALRYLQQWRTEDTSWGAGPLASYVNACVVMGLAATQNHRLREMVEDGVRFLTQTQWDESEGVRRTQDWYGGTGYGRHGRPDLSNTQMMLDALHDAGVSADDPAVQRALAFITRAQNLRSTNAAEWAQAGRDDGGFIYTPANGGESFASEGAGEGRYGELRPEGTPRSLRSYGSMTYAGLKSLLYAGLDHDDPRVLAALGWIRRHLTFDENPGLGQQGLFYYYHAMARALVAAQQPMIAPASADTLGDAETARNWRESLVAALVSRQRDDGSWRNETTRWLEGDSELATIYAVLALQECLKPAAR